MKRQKLYLFLLLVLFVVSGCTKKQEDQVLKDEKKKTEQTEVKLPKDLNISENTPIHIIYSGIPPYTKPDTRVELFMQGDKAKCILEYPGQSKGTHWKKDNTWFVSFISTKDTMNYTYKVGTFRDDSNIQAFLIFFKEKIKKLEKKGTDTVLGYTCDIYKGFRLESLKDTLEYSIYKDVIPLKIRGTLGYFVVSKIETDVKFAEDTFTVPQDIKFYDPSHYQKNVAPRRIGGH